MIPRCAIEHLYQRDNKNDNEKETVNHVTLLETATKAAKKSLAHKLLQPAIEIVNESYCSIVVKDYIDDDYRTYFLIYRLIDDNEATTMLKIPHTTYRYIYFYNCVNCKIFIKNKLLRVMFHRCQNCYVALRCPIIGMAEFYKCDTVKINICVEINKHSQQDCSPIPITRIEDCDGIKIFQSNDSLIYLVKMACNVSVTVIHPVTEKNHYDIGKTIWGLQEQILFCVTTRNVLATPIDYQLNTINHHIIQKESSPTDDANQEQEYGTPPIIDSDFLTTRKNI
jgi:hypothetical protein